MKDVIKKIVDMNQQAEIYSEETQKEKESLEEEITREKQKIYDKHMADAKAHMQEKVNELKNESQKSFEKEQQKRKAVLDKLQSEYENNCDGWVDEIVKNVLA